MIEEIKDINKEFYTGWKKWIPTDAELATYYTDNTCPIDLRENEYLIVIDATDNREVSISKMEDGKLVKINHATFKSKNERGVVKTINPRNAEQRCAFDMLSNDRSTVKLITGGWGCGKSLSLIVAGLQALKDNRFDKIVWIRNNVDVKDTKDLGALPGDIYDKLMPFLGPFVDHAGGEDAVKKLIEEKKLVVEPLQYLRGRNLERTLIMCSEAENLTREHLQLIIARCADGSELWLDGDTRQRDKISFENSKGLERLIESLKGNKLFGYVHLTKVERSETASLADKIL